MTNNSDKISKSEQWPGLHKKLFDPKKSSSQMYKELTVGDRGWGTFLYYELVILFFGLIPGALGLVLRRLFFKRLFQEVGRNVIFGRNLNLRQPHRIRIGDNVIIDDDCTLDGKGSSNQGIVIGDFVTMGRFSSLVCKDADISIGSHVNIGTNVKIIAANNGKIEIGNSIDIGSGCHFSGGSYDYTDADQLPSSRRIETKGIRLEDLAWIGAGVIVLDGVNIGTKSIVGAGAVVTTDIPPATIATGVPAKVSRTRVGT
ncbi:MAG: acyltransferase [Anaerolineales bacterium]|jgi:acetyltransferase-like isoleucine patch superfamily enzyme